MTAHPNWFVSCSECGGNQPNYSGICAGCEVKHGYRDRLVDDVQPDQREPKEQEQ